MTFSPSVPGRPLVFRYLSSDPKRRRRIRRKGPPLQLERKGAQPHAVDVILRFGGVPELVDALRAVGLPKHKACIYRWLFPYPRGTSGRIPPKAWLDIQVAAKHAKVSLEKVRWLPQRPHKNERGVWMDALEKARAH